MHPRHDDVITDAKEIKTNVNHTTLSEIIKLTVSIVATMWLKEMTC